MKPISSSTAASATHANSSAFGPFMEAAASGGPMIGHGSGRRTMHPSAVRELQAALVARGFKLAVDGKFGPLTRGAVMAFQRATRAFPVDGVVGPITMRAFKGFAGNVAAMIGKALHGASNSNFTPAAPGAPSATVASLAPASSADALREQIARWAVAQADNPNIGYSQTKGRFGNATDSNGVRYFDCSGLVYSAYKQAGVTLGGNWTGAMRSTWPQWAQQVPKNPGVMKPGDLLLMNGHVVMYIGNGKCVGAQTSHTNLRDQVTTNIDVNRYLARPDCIVLRPNVPAGLAG